MRILFMFFVGLLFGSTHGHVYADTVQSPFTITVPKIGEPSPQKARQPARKQSTVQPRAASPQVKPQGAERPAVGAPVQLLPEALRSKEGPSIRQQQVIQSPSAQPNIERVALRGMSAIELEKLGDPRFIEEYLRAPSEPALWCVKEENCRDQRRGFAKIQAVVVEDSPYVAAVADGKLPSEYVPLLEARIGTPDLRRARCDQVVFIFSNMGDEPVPVGPYPVTGHHGQYRTTAWIETVPITADGLGYPATVVNLNHDPNRPESRAARLHVPEWILTRADNPIVGIQVFHQGRQVPLIYSPSLVPGTLYSTPRNEAYGRKNSLHEAARNGSRLFMPVVPRGSCS